MARYGRRRSYYGRASYGSERAREHIEEARRLTAELGGADEAVKRWLFSLPKYEMARILGIYGNAYGNAARDYAEKVIPKWESGRVQMSGMVAERLFKLLPPFMPLTLKYEIVEGLWRHYGPASKRTVYVGPDIDLPRLAALVQDHVNAIVTSYRIPSQLEQRFEWIAANDVGVKQDLLNHLRALDKALAVDAVRVQVPVLLDHLRADVAGHTKRLAHIVTVGKHELELVLDRKASGIQDRPSPAVANFPANVPGWAWLLAGAMLLWFFLKH
jgi:hypothetical protein